MLAASMGSASTAKVLIENGANVNYDKGILKNNLFMKQLVLLLCFR